MCIYFYKEVIMKKYSLIIGSFCLIMSIGACGGSDSKNYRPDQEEYSNDKEEHAKMPKRCHQSAKEPAKSEKQAMNVESKELSEPAKAETKATAEKVSQKPAKPV